MSLDIRIPIGLLFGIIGVLLVGVGVTSTDPAMYAAFAGLQRQLLVGSGVAGLRRGHALLGPPRQDLRAKTSWRSTVSKVGRYSLQAGACRPVYLGRHSPA